MIQGPSQDPQGIYKEPSGISRDPPDSIDKKACRLGTCQERTRDDKVFERPWALAYLKTTYLEDAEVPFIGKKAVGTSRVSVGIRVQRPQVDSNT